MYSMLFGNNSGGGANALLDGAPFYLELTHTAVPARGTGSPTFTRASTATFTDWEGVLKTVPSGCARFEGGRMVRNLVNTTSEDFSNAAWDKVLCTVTAGFADPDGGTGAYRLQSTGVGGYLEQVIATTKMPIANAAVMSWYVKSNTGASQTVKSARFAGIESKTVTTSWQRLEHFTASAGGSNFYLQDNGGNNLDILIYKCQIEDVTGQADQTASEYVSVGVVSAPYHGAGVDGVKYFNTDLTGAAIPAATNLGYLAEGARTNLCLQSQSFDTTWAATALTTISSTRTAPDGTATAFEFDDGVSGGTSHRRFQSLVNTTAVPHTMSVYAKDVDRGWIGFRLTDSGGVNRLCWFNIAAGVVGTAAAGFTTSIQSLPNGWYRCIATLTTFAGDSTPLLFLAPSDGVDVYVGSNKKAQLWGAQVELGSSASTYIPTTTAAVTRAADVLTYPSAGNISDAAGWCSVEMKLLKSPSGSVGTIGSSGSSAAIYNNAGQPEIYRLFDGTGGAAVAGATSLNASVKTASTWGGTTSQLAVNGTAGSVGTFDGSLNFGANIYIGSLASGAGSELNGTIRNVRIGQRQLSASEMQAITA
jgi:hypothetical protein